MDLRYGRYFVTIQHYMISAVAYKKGKNIYILLNNRVILTSLLKLVGKKR